MATVDHIVEGIVVIRGALTIDQQLSIIDIVERNSTFKDADGKWNFFGVRGRYFTHLDKYNNREGDSQYLKDCFAQFKHYAVNTDKTLDWASATHLLTFWYPKKQGIGWHTDSDKGGNDGDPGAPVYSLTIGNSCIFEYYLVGGGNVEVNEGEKPKKYSVELRSGDLIVFGGPQRMMMHQVKKVITGTFKEKPGFNARINLTFRTLSNFTEEDEAMYDTDSYVTSLKQK